ncbi:MAG: hypothetical protein ABSF69_04570 [Polyangiaceae bacterium]
MRISTRLSVPLRIRLAKHCAASGISERTIIEDAVAKYLDDAGNTALLLRRLDRIEQALADGHRDVEILSEAFGRYLRLWFTAHVPDASQGKGFVAVASAEKAYAWFARQLAERLSEGHRFVDDLPDGAGEGDEDTSAAAWSEDDARRNP